MSTSDGSTRWATRLPRPDHDQASSPGVISPIVYSSLVSPVNPSTLFRPMPAFLNRTASTTTGMDSVTNENTAST